MLFLLVSVVGGLTPGASAPGKPPPGRLKAGYALGEETRAETGPRQHEDHPPPRSQPGTTPGSAASSPGRRSGGPATAPAARPAGGPAQAGQPTASGPGPPAPRPRHSPPRSTAAPRTQPRQQDRPTASHSPTEPGQRTPYYYTPVTDDSPPGRRQRPTLDSWTGSGSPTPTGSTPDTIPARTPTALYE